MRFFPSLSFIANIGKSLELFPVVCPLTVFKRNASVFVLCSVFHQDCIQALFSLSSSGLPLLQTEFSSATAAVSICVLYRFLIGVASICVLCRVLLVALYHALLLAIIGKSSALFPVVALFHFSLGLLPVAFFALFLFVGFPFILTCESHLKCFQLLALLSCSQELLPLVCVAALTKIASAAFAVFFSLASTALPFSYTLAMGTSSICVPCCAFTLLALLLFVGFHQVFFRADIGM